MCTTPCIGSVCGLELRLSVVIIGVVQLLVTVVATVLNVVKYSNNLEDKLAYNRECLDKDICIGIYSANS